MQYNHPDEKLYVTVGFTFVSKLETKEVKKVLDFVITYLETATDFVDNPIEIREEEVKVNLVHDDQELGKIMDDLLLKTNKTRIYVNRNSYKVQYRKKLEIKIIYKWLYNYSKRFLYRKKKKFEDILKIYKNRG